MIDKQKRLQKIIELLFESHPKLKADYERWLKEQSELPPPPPLDRPDVTIDLDEMSRILG